MLDKLKKFTSGWVAQLMLLLLVLSFAVWGVADIFTGYGANSVARVGKVEITGADFQRDYDQALQALNQRVGGQLSSQQAIQFGLPSQVLGRLIAKATLDDSARRMGLGLSGDWLGKLIAQDPKAIGPSGVFDKVMFEQIARQQGMTSDQYILDRRAEYLRSQLAQAFVGGMTGPESYLRAAYEYQAEERTVSFVVVEAPPLSEIPAPGDSDLSTYFEAHKSDWRAPEYRAISYFELSPASIGREDEVTDEDARKRYDGQPARYITPGTRQVSQIVFKDRAEADAAAAELTAGTTFDAVVAKRELKPADIDLGQVTRDKIADPAIAEAAFKLAEGGVSGVIDGRFGPAIVRAQNLKPEVVKSFDEAKAELKSEIAAERAVGEISDLHDSIEDARAGGAKLAEVAEKYGLNLVTNAALDSDGQDPDGKAVVQITGGPALVTAAFETDAGLENDPLQPERNTFVWYEVTSVTPPRDRPLAEVRDKVLAAWQAAEAAKKADDKAAGMRARLDAGEEFAKVATDSGLTVQKAEKVTRSATDKGDLKGQAITAAFQGPKGHIAVAPGGTPQSRVVLVVEESTIPQFNPTVPGVEANRRRLSAQLVEELLGHYIAELQSKIDVNLNQAALQSVLGITPN